ncbi:MAG: hypothetical protein D6705_10980 [Deltaproteobacteria bacterium]|nr:MAG: hypothetical protein D6705_10980 [Deltaproteobacteria bacterium]
MLSRTMVNLRHLLLATLAAGPACMHVEAPSAAPENAAPATDEGAILARYVEALGGRAALESVEALTVEARLSIPADEGCTKDRNDCLATPQRGTFTLVTTADGRMYRRSVLGDTVEERGYDGTTGWQTLPDGAVRLDAPDERIATAEDARLHWYLDPEARGIETKALGVRDVATDDATTRPLVGLSWKVPGLAGPAKELWFDPQTGLLVEEVVRDGEGDEGAVQTIRYLHYRRVAGIAVADDIELETRIGDQSRVVHFVVTRIDTTSPDPSIFAVPTPVPRPMVDAEALVLASARAAASAAPKDASAQAAWARAAYNIGRFDEARRAAEATLRLDPEDAEALFIAATVDLAAGDLRAAKRRLDAARSAGLHPGRLAVLEAALASHRKDAEGLARAHQAAADHGAPPLHRLLATRFAALTGTIDRVTGRACATEIAMVRTAPAPIFHVRIDGREIPAILDTGAADLILDAAHADALGLVRLVRDRLPGGQEVSYGRVERVELGSLAVENVPIEVFPEGRLTEMAGLEASEADDGATVGAIVGLRMLSDLQITFDVPGKRLRLVQETRRCRKALAEGRTGAPIPVWVHDSHYAYVEGAMGEGAPGLWLLNTGMRGMDVAASRAAYARARIAPPIIDPRRPVTVTVGRLQLGPVALADLSGAYGYFERDRTAGGFRIEGMVGHLALADRPWTLSFRRRTLYVPEAPTAATSSPGSDT